jgi:hypothetical protein
MKTHLFPRFTKSMGSRKGVYSAIAALVAIGCVGAVLAQTDFYIPPIQGSTTDMSAWINQQIQGGQTSTQTAVISQCGTSSSGIQIGTSLCTQCGGWTGCGNPCSCQPQVQPDNPTPTPITNPCEPAGCNPFEYLCSKKVTIRLEENVSLTGFVALNCRGFLILQSVPGNKILTVNIQKILYIESN